MAAPAFISQPGLARPETRERGPLGYTWQDMTDDELVDAIDASARRPRSLRSLTDDQEGEVRTAVAPTARRRAIPIDDDGLRRVAETYRKAVATQQRRTRAVQLAENVSRSTASRWIKQAGERGFLGAARPRVARILNVSASSACAT
jgi:hypothetical protein